jgi:hypothetical protein
MFAADTNPDDYRVSITMAISSIKNNGIIEYQKQWQYSNGQVESTIIECQAQSQMIIECQAQ